MTLKNLELFFKILKKFEIRVLVRIVDSLCHNHNYFATVIVRSFNLHGMIKRPKPKHYKVEAYE